MLTWVEISKKNLQSNLQQAAKLTAPAELWAVVKSNAYGHGLSEVMSCIGSSPRVKGFVLASLEEAISISRLTRKPLSVVSFWDHDPKVLRQALRRGIILTIYNLKDGFYLETLGAKWRRKVAVQVKIDVGTSRLGFRPDQAVAAIKQLRKFRHLSITDLFSHFADSENADLTYSDVQFNVFDRLISRLAAEGIRFERNHLACSAALIRRRRYHLDAVRLGLGLYGLWPSEATAKSNSKITLTPVLSWKTRVIQIKEVRAGESVGYGRSFRADRALRLAILPVGYWDGFDRLLSNSGAVLINGQRCAVRGRVCMNVSMVELPLKIKVALGDEVILIGRQGRSEITVEEIARKCQTINYEIVTRINPLIPRIVI